MKVSESQAEVQLEANKRLTSLEVRESVTAPRDREAAKERVKNTLRGNCPTWQT